MNEYEMLIINLLMKKILLLFFLLKLCLLLLNPYLQAQTPQIDSLTNLFKTTKEDTNLVNIKNKIAYHFFYIDPKNTKKYADEAYILAEKLSFQKGMTEAECWRGVALELTGNLKEALIKYKEVILMAQKYNFPLFEMRGYTFAGLCYTGMGDYENAVENHLKSLFIAETIKNDAGLGNAYNNLSGVYFADEKLEKCLEYALKAEKLYKKINNKANWVNTLNNLGMLYLHIKDTTNAIKYFEETRINAEKIGNQRIFAQSSMQLGKIWLEKKDFEKATLFLKNAEKIQIEINDNYNLTSVSLLLAELNFRQKDFITAQKYLNLADSLIQKTQAFELLKDFYYTQALFYEGKKDYEKALFLTKKYYFFKDSIQSKERTEKIVKLEAKYNDEKKDAQIKIQQSEIKQKTYTNYALMVLSVLIFIILFLIYRNNLQNKKIFINERNLKQEENNRLQVENELKQEENKLLAIENDLKQLEAQKLQEGLQMQQQLNQIQQEKHQLDLDYKNQELASATLHIIQKNEVLGELKTTLEKEKPNLETSKIIKQIDSSIKIDDDWDKFKMHFELVHTGFFERLINNYPKLSNNDLRMCAYMRMNLNNKDIAQILHISPDSFDKNRQRLRKKLELEAGANLVRFMIEV